MNPSDCFSRHWTCRAWKDFGLAEKFVQWYDYRRHFNSKLLYFLAVQPFVLCQFRAVGHLINLSCAWTSLKNPTASLAVGGFFVMHLCLITGALKCFPLLFTTTHNICVSGPAFSWMLYICYFSCFDFWILCKFVAAQRCSDLLFRVGRSSLCLCGFIDMQVRLVGYHNCLWVWMCALMINYLYV